jgi:hypothetical protein
LIVVCVSLTAFVFFAATATIVVLIVATVTVAVAVVVVCCRPQWHLHARMIVNLAASFPLRRDNDKIQQRAKGIDEPQREAMRSNWSDVNTAKNRARGLLAEEPQAP